MGRGGCLGSGHAHRLTSAVTERPHPTPTHPQHTAWWAAAPGFQGPVGPSLPRPPSSSSVLGWTAPSCGGGGRSVAAEGGAWGARLCPPRCTRRALPRPSSGGLCCRGPVPGALTSSLATLGRATMSHVYCELCGLSYPSESSSCDGARHSAPCPTGNLARAVFVLRDFPPAGGGSVRSSEPPAAACFRISRLSARTCNTAADGQRAVSRSSPACIG